MWDLMERWYARSGIQAWGDFGAVPCYITSNSFIATRYSSLIAGLVRDLQHLEERCPGEAHRGRFDPTEPLYVVEVAGGHGKLTHLLLMALSREPFLSEAKVVVVLTDFVQSSVEGLMKKRELQPWIDKGMLDFAVFDAYNTTHLHLQVSNVTLGPRTEATNPMVCLCNYAFDTMKADNFRLSQGLLLEGLATTRVWSAYADPLEDPAAITNSEVN